MSDHHWKIQDKRGLICFINQVTYVLCGLFIWQNNRFINVEIIDAFIIVSRLDVIMLTSYVWVVRFHCGQSVCKSSHILIVSLLLSKINGIDRLNMQDFSTCIQIDIASRVTLPVCFCTYSLYRTITTTQRNPSSLNQNDVTIRYHTRAINRRTERRDCSWICVWRACLMCYSKH